MVFYNILFVLVTVVYIIQWRTVRAANRERDSYIILYQMATTNFIHSDRMRHELLTKLRKIDREQSSRKIKLNIMKECTREKQH